MVTIGVGVSLVVNLWGSTALSGVSYLKWGKVWYTRGAHQILLFTGI